MKVFIVFLGILFINISFLTFQGDMAKYVQSQEFLKATAEECAAGAALFYSEDSYSEGRMVFNAEEGKKYIESIIEKSSKKMPLPSGSNISYEVKYEDDFRGYENQEIPSVTVGLTAVTEDIFKLPFIEVKEVKRTAKYELPQ